MSQQPGAEIEENFLEVNLEEGITKEIPVVCGFNRTDMGNAERLVALHGDVIRYCNELNEWHIWNGVRWVPDRVGRIQELAKDTVRLIHSEVSFVDKGDSKKNKKERRELTRWAYASEAQARIREMIKCAQSDTRISVLKSDFNANKHLINCPNGTIDLKNRVVRPHDRNDLLTMMAAAPYDPFGAGAIFFPTLLKALPPTEVIYGQRLLGSFLEPTTQNKEWLFVYGMPFALKSSVTQAVYAALGDYAVEFDISLLTKQRHAIASNAARPELVALDSVRIAWTEETPDDFVIDEAMLKGLTSSGKKSARQLYGKQEVIELICSFVVESNGAFSFDIEDEWQRDAALQRTKVMKFVRQVPEDERDASKLIALTHDEEELTAALAWVVQGYFDRQDFGLDEPDTIKATSEEFQQAINPLNEFVKNEVFFESSNEQTETALVDLVERFNDTADPETLKSVKNSRSFNIHFGRVAPCYAKQAGVDIRSFKRGNRVVWENVRLAELTDDPDVDTTKKQRVGKTEKSRQNDDLLKTPMNLLQFVKGLVQNGFLPNIPAFPDIQIEGFEELNQSFFEMEPLKESIQMVRQNSQQPHEPPKHDTEKLHKFIHEVLRAFKEGKTGAMDATTEEFTASLSGLVKKRLPEFEDYDVGAFYTKLLKNDKATQAMVADLMGGAAAYKN